jgi:hypothetical protein
MKDAFIIILIGLFLTYPSVTFAKGGGCFLENALILTPDGPKSIQDLKPGDEVVSFNVKNKSFEISKVQRVDKLNQPSYLIINEYIRVTPTHPFYTSDLKTVEAGRLKIGDQLVSEQYTPVSVDSIEVVNEVATVFNLINVEPNNNYFADGVLVHNKGSSGGGGRGGISTGARGGKSGATISKSTTTTKGVGAKPASTTRTTTAKTTRTVNGKTYSKTGYVVDKDYQPTFRGGYTPPLGSSVYYQSSPWDWLPFYYIMTHNSHSTAVVQQPDGKQIQTEDEGTDGWYVFNWIMVILISLGLIGLVVWFVNQRTEKSYSY